MIQPLKKEQLIQRLLAITLLAVLVVLCFKVVKFFISPALWGAILAYVTFPIYTFFHKKVRFSPNFSALIITASICIIIGVPLVLGVLFLQHEVLSLYSTLVHLSLIHI